MRRILEEIQDGRYAKAWIEENATGRAWFEGQRATEQEHAIEQVGRKLRRMMPFLQAVEAPEPALPQV
jgi:ketol-acid reductoisomerase